MPNQPEVIYMFAMSLDGFIARPNGSFDWLENYPANADFDFDAFLASVTGIVMGRGSYDAARRLEEWAYGRYPCVVATSRPVENLPAGTVAMAAEPAELLADLRARGADGRIWLFGGGDLVPQFIEAGVLDTIEIGIIPVILGNGISAFGGAQPDRWLDLDFAKPLANGAIHARYITRHRRP
ncbi:MAG: dihydrofolate reductase [Rhizobiaceae bacterium]|nr:dihydrofolate reductase [Rhizobiaceae bacterium]